MLFNSIDFAIFLPVVFLLYWFVTNQNLKAQNLLVVLASYVFYGWWDWRFLSLILISTMVDYFVGLGLLKQKKPQKRKLLLWLSILVNLGFLGFFKYYNFFLENFIEAFSILGYKMKADTMNIVLPVGISFYTFQTLSYTIDVYKRKLEPTRDFIAFAAFVSFFPQLVAGPIERAKNLLPQFYRKRNFDYSKATDGLRQILWGLFKKVVIADTAAVFVNAIFANHPAYSGSELLLGGIFFAFQIYGDFSGYSDIAIGTARLFGFDLMRNFAFPYFSRDIAEFWRRWHISLSTWFRDYLYIPLGGSRVNNLLKIRNIFVIFVVSGFWHGASWTFIAWGFLNALYFLPLMLFERNRKNIEIVANNNYLPSFRELAGILTTFALTVLAWIFFRAENIGHAFDYLSGIFSETLFTTPDLSKLGDSLMLYIFLAMFILIEWIGRKEEYALSKVRFVQYRPLRWLVYSLLVFIIFMYTPTKESPFIYFQF